MAAPPDAVWRELLAVVGRLDRPPATGYGRLVGVDPRSASGPRPLAVGSTVPGFRVVRAEPGRELALEGRHRFSTYALAFRVEPGRLSAETRAGFPGLPGAAYRAAVIGSGAHALLVRRLLDGVRRRAEGGG